MRIRNLGIGAALMMAVTAPAVTQTPNLAGDLQRAKQREAAGGDCKAVLPEYMRNRRSGRDDRTCDRRRRGDSEGA
jgi:hypothetical protein